MLVGYFEHDEAMIPTNTAQYAEYVTSKYLSRAYADPSDYEMLFIILTWISWKRETITCQCYVTVALALFHATCPFKRNTRPTP